MSPSSPQASTSASERLVRVEPVKADCSEDLITNFFTFHGKINRVDIRGTTAFIEFADMSAARSALLFDKASFLGETIAVTMADISDGATPPAPKQQETGEEEGEDRFVKVEKPSPSEIAADNANAAAADSPLKAPLQPASALPMPAAATAAPASPPPAPPSVTAAAPKASQAPSPGAPKAPTPPSAPPSTTSTGHLSRCLRALAMEPLNEPTAALALNLAAGLLLAACS